MLGFERYELLADFNTIDRVIEDLEDDERTQFAFLETEPARDSDDVGMRLTVGFAILSAAERD